MDLLEEQADEEVAELDFDFLLQDFLQDILEDQYQLAKELGDKQDKKSQMVKKLLVIPKLVYNLLLNSCL